MIIIVEKVGEKCADIRTGEKEKKVIELDSLHFHMNKIRL